MGLSVRPGRDTLASIECSGVTVGTCEFCGQSAGLFRKFHPQCAEVHASGLAQLTALAKDAASGKSAGRTIAASASELQARCHLQPSEVRECYVRGWEAAVESLLEDGVLTLDEERTLQSFTGALELTQEELNQHGKLRRVVEAGALRNILDGHFPERQRIEGSLPFNFQKGEQLIWVFDDVTYLEDRVRRSYVGGSSGVSLRIAKGVYYRVGGFRGESIDRTQRVEVDRGLLAVTTKHIYFGGPRKSFRIRHEKIVSYLPFSDGVGIVRDAASAKPQLFVTGDGWFVHNLLANGANLESLT
jgi:hypothetical protein